MSDSKSFCQPKQLIYLTIEDYQFDNKKIQNSFECRVRINEQDLDVLSLHKVSLEIPIYSYEDTLTLLFITPKNEIIGSITFILDLFAEQRIVKRCIHQKKSNQIIQNRITLFNPDDDNYDGDFLEDDTEFPRVLLNFQMTQISNEYTSQDQSKYVYMSNLNSLNGAELNHNEAVNSHNINTHSSNSCTYNIPINTKSTRPVEALQLQDENREINQLSSSATKRYSKEAENTHQELEQLKKDFELELQKIKQATLDFTNERDTFLKSQKLSSANTVYENLSDKISKQISEFIVQNNQQRKQNEQISSLEKDIYSLRTQIATRDINIKDQEQKLKIMKQREEQLYVQIQALNVVIEDIKQQNQELKQQNHEISNIYQNSERNGLNLHNLKGDVEQEMKERYDEQMNSFDKEVRDLQEEIQKRQAKELDNESKLKEYELQFKIQEKKIQQLIQKESESVLRSKQNQSSTDEDNFQLQQSSLLEQIKKNYELSINNLTDIIQSKDKLISELNQQLYMSLQPENDLSQSNCSQKLANAQNSSKKSEQQEILENEVIRHAQLLQEKEKRLNELIYENNDLREKDFNLLQKLNISKSEGITKIQMLQQRNKELELQFVELREKNYHEYHERELINAKYERIQSDFSKLKEVIALKDLELNKQNSLLQELQYENSQIPSLKDIIQKLEFNYLQIQYKFEEIESDNRELTSKNRIQEDSLTQMREQNESLLVKYEEIQQKQEVTIVQMEQLAQRTEELLTEISTLTEERDLWKIKYENGAKENEEKEKDQKNSVHEIKQAIMIMQQNLDSLNIMLNEERSISQQLQEELLRINQQKNLLEKQAIENSNELQVLIQREAEFKQEIDNLQQTIAYNHQELLQQKEQFASQNESNKEFKEEAQKKFEYMNQIIKQKQQEIEDLQNQTDQLEKQLGDNNNDNENKLQNIIKLYEQKILELEDYNKKIQSKFAENMEDLKKNQQKEKELVIKKAKQEIDDLQNGDLKNLKIEVKQLQINLQCTEDSLRQSIESAQQQNVQLKQKEQLVTELENKIQELERQNKEIQNQSERSNQANLKKINSLQLEHQMFIDQIQEAHKTIQDQMNQQIQSQSEQLIIVKNNQDEIIQSYDEQIEQLIKEKNLLEQQLEKVQSEILTKNELIKQSTEEKEEFKTKYENTIKENQENLQILQEQQKQVEKLQNDLQLAYDQQLSTEETSKYLNNQLKEIQQIIIIKTEQLEQSEQIIVAQEEKYKRQQEELSNVFNDCESLRQQLVQLDEAGNELNDLLAQAQKQSQTLEEQLKEEKSITLSLQKEIGEIQILNKQLQDKYNEENIVAQEIKEQLKQQLSMNNTLTQQIDEYLTNIKEKDTQIELLNNKQLSINKQIKEKDLFITQQNQQLLNLQQECQSLESSLLKTKADSQGYQGQKEQEINTLQQILDEKEKEVEEISMQIKSISELLEINTKETEERNSMLHVLQTENENTKNNVIQLLHQIDDLQKQEQKLKNQISQKEILVNENVEQIKMINEQLVICEIKLKENRQFEKECQEKEDQINQLQSQIILLKDQNKLLEVQFEEQESEANKYKKINSQIDQQYKENEKKLFQSQLEIEELKTQQNLSQLLQSKLENELQISQEQYENEIQKLQDEYEQSKNALIEDIKDLEIQLNEAKESLDNQNQTLKKIIEDVEEEKLQLQLQLNQLQQQVEELKAFNEQTLATKLQDEAKRYSDLKEKYLIVEENYQKSQEKILQSENLLKEAQEQENLRNSFLNDLNNKIQKTNALNKSLSAKVEELQKQNEQLSQMNDNKIASEKAKNEELEQKLEDLQNQLNIMIEDQKSNIQNNNNLFQSQLDRIQREKEDLSLLVEKQNIEKENILKELELLKHELEQTQIDRNVLQEEVQLLNKMANLQEKTRDNEFQASFSEQLEEANRIKLELIENLQAKERELSEKEADLLATKQQEESLLKKIENLRNSQELKQKQQITQYNQESEELENIMNKYSEEKRSMIQTINELEYTIEKLVKQNELLSSEIEKRDKEFISLCAQFEECEQKLASQSDSISQEKFESIQIQLREKQLEVERIHKMSEETILALKQQIEQQEISHRNQCDKLIAEQKGSGQERDHNFLRELQTKEQLLSKLREDLLEQKQKYEEELRECKQRNNQMVLNMEEDYCQKMDILRNDLMQQFNEQYGMLKLKQEQQERQNGESIQSIITEKNEIIDRVLNEKNDILNDFSNQKNSLYNEFTNEKSRLIEMNENLLEEISRIRQALHTKNNSESQQQNSASKNRKSSENDYPLDSIEDQNKLAEQLIVKDKMLTLKQQEILDLEQEKEKIEQHYKENLIKNDELINRVQEISQRNQDLIYQNEELTEIFENNQHKFQELSELYQLRMREIHQLQDQLNCQQFNSPSKLSFQNKDFVITDRVNENDDSNLLSNNNLLLMNNDLSCVPLEGVDNTSYQNDIPQQESFFEKHPAALAAVQASNSARKQISYNGLSYDDLLKKISLLNEELYITRQQDEDKQIRLEELQRQLEIMRNQQNEIEFSLMQQQHNQNNQVISTRQNNTQRSLIFNQQPISEFSITNFNSTAPVCLTGNTFEAKPEHPTTDRQDTSKLDNNQAFTDRSRGVQMAQTEATIIKLQFELEREINNRVQLAEENELLGKHIDDLLKQLENLQADNKTLIQQQQQQSKAQTLNQSELIQSQLTETLEDPKNYTPRQQPKNSQQVTPNKGISTSPFNRLITPNDKFSNSNFSATKKSPLKKIDSKSGFKQQMYQIQDDHELNNLIEKHIDMIKDLQQKNKQLQEENDQLKESLGKNLDELQLKNDEIQLKYEEKIQQYNSGYLAKYSLLIKENEELNFLYKQLTIQYEKVLQQNNQIKDYNRQLIEEKQIFQESIKNPLKQSSPHQSPNKIPIKSNQQSTPTIQIYEAPEFIKRSAERTKTPDNSYNQQEFLEHSPQFQKFINGLEKQYQNSNYLNNKKNQQMYFLNDNYSDIHKSDILSNSNNTSANNINLSKSASKLPPSGQKKDSASFIFSQSKGDQTIAQDTCSANNSQINQQPINYSLSGSKSQRYDKSRSLSNSNAKNSLLQLKAIASRESPFK